MPHRYFFGAKLNKEPHGNIALRLNLGFRKVQMLFFQFMSAVGAIPNSFLKAVEKCEGLRKPTSA